MIIRNCMKKFISVLTTIFIFLVFASSCYAVTEDLTTYTEVDPSNRFTVTSSKVDVTTWRRDEGGYVSKDYGAGYFDAVDIDFEIYQDSVTYDGGRNGIALSSTGVGSQTEFAATQILVYVTYYQTGTTARWGMIRGENLEQYVSASFTEDVVWYFTLSREAGATTIYCYMYDDSARTNLIDTLSLTGVSGATTWQYFFANTHDYYPARDSRWTGYIQNIEINTGGEPTPLLGSGIMMAKASIAKVNQT